MGQTGRSVEHSVSLPNGSLSFRLPIFRDNTCLSGLRRGLEPKALALPSQVPGCALSPQKQAQ